MTQPAPATRSTGLAMPAAWVYAALVVYASLYPFDDWRWPPGRLWLDMLALPWPRYRPAFDLWANLLGYLPLGLLVALATRRRSWAVLFGVLLPALLSYGAEVAQHFLPGRHPSLLDLSLNSAGALLGALLGVALRALGWGDRWRAWQTRWFERVGATPLLLLALWPVGLLFPAPVALGLGQIGPRLRPWLAGLLDGVPWAEPWLQALTTTAPKATPSPAIELMITWLGLLAPCLVAFAVVAPGWRRAVLTAGAALLAIGVETLSTALNFGPDRALAWWTATTTPALLGALLGAVMLMALPSRLAAGVGLIVLTAQVILVTQAPVDPYFAQNLQAWEQGRFINLHGVAQWIGILWPYAALAWLLTRLGSSLESGP